jgi:bioF: 8-amino-7-oxononanoate synthase
MNTIHEMQQELQLLEAHSNLRRLPEMTHDGREVIVNGKRMLNLSSNDYLGLASDRALREEFLRTLTPDTFLPTSSSSRLLTGNFSVYEELEAELSHLFGTEAALVFNSGYHANTGILPAVSDAQTLILADKLVHASLIDGIRLSAAKCHPLPPQRPEATGTVAERTSHRLSPNHHRHRKHLQHGRRPSGFASLSRIKTPI